MSEIITVKIESSKYGDAVQLDEYNGGYALIAAREGKDGKIYLQWVFAQDKDRKPRDKAMPLKISLGSDKDEAVKTLRELLECLDANDGVPF